MENHRQARHGEHLLVIIGSKHLSILSMSLARGSQLAGLPSEIMDDYSEPCGLRLHVLAMLRLVTYHKIWEC